MNQLPLSTRRMIAGFALVLIMLCAANYYCGFHLFGRFDKHVMVSAFVVAGVSQIFFGATPAELREYRDSKRHRRDARHNSDEPPPGAADS